MLTFALAGAALLLIGCDPLAPIPTPTAAVLIVTPEASPTLPPSPIPSDTPPPTPSPAPTDTPAPTLPACTADAGQVIAISDFRSATANETLPYRVYIPPCYLEYQKRYPVVFLLHGLGERETQWENLGIISALEQGLRLRVLAPMILVMPSYGRIGERNAFPPDPAYETVLLNELLPDIDRDFCTITNARHRALAGISRGGFWAFSIGLRHPDVFGTLGGHSASFDARNAPAAFNPLDLALNSPFLGETGVRMYLDNGASDPAGTELERFSSRLSSRAIAHEYVINPVGGHDAAYWRSHIAEYLTFYARNWERDVSALPSCLEPSP